MEKLSVIQVLHKLQEKASLIPVLHKLQDYYQHHDPNTVVALNYDNIGFEIFPNFKSLCDTLNPRMQYLDHTNEQYPSIHFLAGKKFTYVVVLNEVTRKLIK